MKGVFRGYFFNLVIGDFKFSKNKGIAGGVGIDRKEGVFHVVFRFKCWKISGMEEVCTKTEGIISLQCKGAFDVMDQSRRIGWMDEWAKQIKSDHTFALNDLLS